MYLIEDECFPILLDAVVVALVVIVLVLMFFGVGNVRC